MPLTIASFIKSDSEFIPVTKFQGPLPDPDYIEGAIECGFDGCEIMGFEHWDLIDQLWAYITDGLVQMQTTGGWNTCFPDQPLSIRCRKIPGEYILFSVGSVSVTMGHREFVRSFQKAGIVFFREMRRIAPSGMSTWEDYLSVLRSIHSDPIV